MEVISLSIIRSVRTKGDIIVQALRCPEDSESFEHDSEAKIPFVGVVKLLDQDSDRSDASRRVNSLIFTLGAPAGD